MIGVVVVLAVLAASAGVRSARRRRRSRARKWYHDHARLTPSSYGAVRLDRPAADPESPSIRLAVRDLGLRTCRLEENTTR
jgi:hypothetical protein